MNAEDAGEMRRPHTCVTSLRRDILSDYDFIWKYFWYFVFRHTVSPAVVKNIVIDKPT